VNGRPTGGPKPRPNSDTACRKPPADAYLPEVKMANLNAALTAVRTETVKLNQNSPVVGKNLAELNLRNETGVILIAAIRDSETRINPGANYKFQANDILVLLGASEKIENAIKILQPDSKIGGFNP
jgi:K+/H+ antiporter YhaU regulatory subunit KhtT